jgi:raffinose/stachyose/melibiose transport system substrate-binding protein
MQNQPIIIATKGKGGFSMKKRVLAMLLTGAMSAGLLAGCGSSGSSAPAAESVAENATQSAAPAAESTEATASEAATEDSGEINIFISSPEYADAMNTLIEEYQSVVPNVTINYETTQNDYPTMLKAKINSGDVPDIFSSTSGMEIDAYREYSYDLTNEPIASVMDDGVKLAMASAEEGGKGVYGLAIKGNYFGMVYNKDVLSAAGVEVPETLEDFKSACEKIKAAGYQPVSTGFMEWWVPKQSSMNFLNWAAAANGETSADMVKKFQAGEAKISDYDVLYNNWFDFVDTCVAYGDDKPLETDLAGEEQALASGNVGFILGQGPWVESDLLAINPDLNIGFCGYPCDDDPAHAQVISGSDQALHVYKDSTNLQATLNFVNWWYTSEYGQAWFTDVANVVPPIKTDKESSSTIVEQGKAAVEAKQSGALSECYSTDSFNQAFGEAMQSYIAGTADKDATCEQIEKSWHEIDGAAAQ